MPGHRKVVALSAVFASLLTVGCSRHAASVDAGSGAADAGDAGALGAQWLDGGSGIAFSIRSANATRMELSLFSQSLGASAVLTVPLAQSGDTWQTSVTLSQLQAAGINSTVYYGYRAWGPNWPYDPSWTPGSDVGFSAQVDAQGNRFNPNKLLMDPYAREISHDPYQPGMADQNIYDASSRNRDKDSAPSAMKGIVLVPQPLDFGTKPAGALKDDIIYEVHLRGLTENAPDAGSCPGTYAAAATWVPYLKSLGVTAVEFQPIFETENDTNTDTEPSNYWGYSTLAFFAPDRHYACDQSPGGPTREFVAMVHAYHDAGLKVVLDVVYNHTAETGSQAVLSWVGLDNATYYELDATGTGYQDNTGLGSNVNAANPIVRDWVMDSLHYWTQTMGADGFRFDLAPILGNGCLSVCFQFDPYDPANVLNRAVAELPGTLLIAEPWASGTGTYQVGAFPVGWSSWNDQFRNGVRSAQNELGVSAPTMGGLSGWLNGSPTVYDNGQGPEASINYLVSHDGFTLNDLYSCDAPNDTQAFPYGPSTGGSTYNLSWDQGGAAVAQAQAARTGMLLLMTSAGTPMMTGGDEILRTVRCNNNPYNLDSVATWLDWSTLPAHQDQLTFTQRLLAFRSAHAALRPGAYRTGAQPATAHLPDVSWYMADGQVASAGYLTDGTQTFLAERISGEGTGDTVESVLVAYNEGASTVSLSLPASVSSSMNWYLIADTSSALASSGYVVVPGTETAWTSSTYSVASRSAVIFVER
jgi:isoamylase